MKNRIVLEKFNWDEDSGKINKLPNIEFMKDFLNEFANTNNLDIELKKRDINYDVQSIVIDMFSTLSNEFKTKKSEVVVYKNSYTINNTNNIFFWENESDEVFYIRPLQMLSLFESAINTIIFSLDQEIEIKTMNEEEDEKYWTLLESNKQKEAEDFRSQFYKDFSAYEDKEKMELLNKYILEAVSASFESKISTINYNGNKTLNAEIVNFIENNLGDN